MPRSDELIKQDVIEQLVWNAATDASKIRVEVEGGAVVLEGEVPTYRTKVLAESETLAVSGVTDVENRLRIRYPLAQPLPTDAEVEASIRRRLLADVEIEIREPEVTVVDGEATLRGTVEAYWQKIRAEEIVMAEPGILDIENLLAVVPSGDLVDRDIAAEIVDSIARRAVLEAETINVEVDDGSVKLTGTVPSVVARRAAYESAVYTRGVVDIEDRLAVNPP